MKHRDSTTATTVPTHTSANTRARQSQNAHTPHHADSRYGNRLKQTEHGTSMYYSLSHHLSLCHLTLSLSVALLASELSHGEVEADLVRCQLLRLEVECGGDAEQDARIGQSVLDVRADVAGGQLGLDLERRVGVDAVL